MKIPTIKGVIDRRMLVNFTIDADVAKKVIPSPFTPKIIDGKAIGGICLIRLKQVRPKGLPAFIGFGSENGAHRFAVEWMENGALKEGVYVPRRDTSSGFNTLAGGRVFPGRHYRAKFDVNEDEGNYHIAFESSDGTTISASSFFKAGSTGFSPNGSKYEGLYLNTYNWEVQALEVSQVHSSYFENEKVFPKGTVHFDNALLMTNINHEWSSVADKPCCV